MAMASVPIASITRARRCTNSAAGKSSWNGGRSWARSDAMEPIARATSKVIRVIGVNVLSWIDAESRVRDKGTAMLASPRKGSLAKGVLVAERLFRIAPRACPSGMRPRPGVSRSVLHRSSVSQKQKRPLIRLIVPHHQHRPDGLLSDGHAGWQVSVLQPTAGHVVEYGDCR